MPLDGISDVNDIDGVSDAEGRTVPVANDGTYSTTVSETPIDAIGTILMLDTRGKRILDLAVSGTSEADYELEASPNGSDWFGPFDSWTAETKILETYRIGARYVRFRVKTAASGGSTASGFMEVS